MRLLVLCPKCQRQYDASGRAIGSRFRCQCGEVLAVEQPLGHEAAVVRCSSCGAPREGTSDHCTHCGADFTLHERDLDTVCPHCLTRVSDQAQFCHHCGQPLIPEPIASESTTYPCPACGEGHTLTSRRMADVNVMECGRCTGVWLGKETLRLLVQRATAEGLNHHPVLPPPAPPPLPSDMPPLPARVYRPCPICQGLMQRQSFGESSGIVIDRCGSHGFWFDENELPRSLTWVRSGGLVEFNLERAIRARQEEPARVPYVESDARPTTHDDGGFEEWDWFILLVAGLAALARFLPWR